MVSSRKNANKGTTCIMCKHCRCHVLTTVLSEILFSDKELFKNYKMTAKHQCRN